MAVKMTIGETKYELPERFTVTQWESLLKYDFETYRDWSKILGTALNAKPEVGTCFTGVNDERGPGGVLHLGTSQPQIMYILVKDPRTGSKKVFMGPVYTSYEVLTDYDTRYNDEEWKTALKKFQPLF